MTPDLFAAGDEEAANSESNAEALKLLFWSNLWAFERVLVHNEPDNGVDYSQQPYESNDKSTPKPADEATNPSLSNTTPQTPRTTASDAHMDVNGAEDDALEIPIIDDDDSGQAPLAIAPSTVSIPQVDVPKKTRLKPLKIAPSRLLEYFTARPEQGRPLTWRHFLEPPLEKFSVEDFTKTPIPSSSNRLMSRQREGILMHKIERALSENAAPHETDSALKTLVARTWGRSFFAALYPITIERLLRFTKYISQKLTLYQSASTALFNLPTDERDSDLTRILRISTIFRNIAYAQQNVSLLASHPGIVAVLCDFCSLEPYFTAASAHQRHSQHYTLAHIRTLQNHWTGATVEIPSQLLAAESSASDAKDKMHAAKPPSLTNALSFLMHLKCDHSASLLEEIQYNGMEALCRIVQLVRFRPLDDTIIDLSQAIDQTNLSSFGSDIQRCLPMLIELALSTTTRSSATFLAVELLAKISMNPNSRGMFLSLKIDSLAALMKTMIQYAVVEDELCDWAMLVPYQLSLNAMSLPIAQALCDSTDVLDNLLLLVSAYASVPKTGTAETLNHLAYRRHVLAMRSAVVINKLVGFVPLGPTLLKYENVIADVYLHAPQEIADPMYRVFLEMQS